MSLYPSLEDMGVDRMIEQQNQMSQHIYQQNQQQPIGIPAYTSNPYPEMASSQQQQLDAQAYPDLYHFMGMELSKEIIAANMPEYLHERNQVAAIGQVLNI